MASLGDTWLDIVAKWGEIDFDFDYYEQPWYHQLNGREAVPAATTTGPPVGQQWTIDALQRVVDEVNDSEKLVYMSVRTLILIAQNLCTWNIAHPLPSTNAPVNGGFVLWRDAAVLAKEAKDVGRINDSGEDEWKAVTAMFLKVWDLEMQEAENPPN